MNYAVLKIFADDTFTTKYFLEWKTAQEYVDRMRSNTSGIVKDVRVYKLMDY